MNIEQLKENKISVGALVSAVSGILEHDIKAMTWEEVEQFRAEVDKVRGMVSRHLNAVETVVLDEADQWKDQWDLALKVYEEVMADESLKKDSIDLMIPHLESKGLVKGLAEIMAGKIVFGDE
ncbi:hypothetical protein AVV29_gp094 [Vibrio phage phi 3]|uniref:Uncharacterized protein n=1 Tax=Vibrio phage phi 3 TaxID=1589298 RepID=A0A0B5HAU4_9CAUD|nr:hypothetical protein AVV29_gp094 [Vibrio phage phi 3]AJF40884.1 hypothetical protein SBVP3_00117 [Vibrio phage phi 3]